MSSIQYVCFFNPVISPPTTHSCLFESGLITAIGSLTETLYDAHWFRRECPMATATVMISIWVICLLASSYCFHFLRQIRVMSVCLSRLWKGFGSNSFHHQEHPSLLISFLRHCEVPHQLGILRVTFPTSLTRWSPHHTPHHMCLLRPTQSPVMQRAVHSLVFVMRTVTGSILSLSNCLAILQYYTLLKTSIF